MNDARINHSSAPDSAGWRSWTSRIILWTLASGIGLWLGMGARTEAAGGQVSRPVASAQAAIADVFRFDILLAGKDARAKQQPARPQTASAPQHSLPAEVLQAMSQRPEPVPSPIPQTLSTPHLRFRFALPVKPAGVMRMKWDERTAHLEHQQKNLQRILATVPGLTATDRESIQTEVDKACAQIGTLRVERVKYAPEPPELPVTHFDEWPARGTQLMP
jgi:hypothetical protein